MHTINIIGIQEKKINSLTWDSKCLSRSVTFQESSTREYFYAFYTRDCIFLLSLTDAILNKHLFLQELK